jgi:hypothetical protein
VNTAAYILDVFNKSAKTINKLSSSEDLAYAEFENNVGEEKKIVLLFKTMRLNQTGTPK